MIKIGVDAGFDYIKIVSDKDTFTNGPHKGLFKFPFNVFQITDETFRAFKFKPSFMSISQERKDFLIGEYAREQFYEKCSAAETKERMSDFYSTVRFQSDDFRKGILTAIGATIVSKHLTHLTNQEDPDLPYDLSFEEDIKLQIAVPVSLSDELAPLLHPIFKGTHVFDIELGEERQKYHIKANIVMCNICPQAIAALIADTSTDCGFTDNEAYDNFFKYGSILLLDNGYGTLAKVPISASGTINPKECTTTFQYTMKDINERVSHLIESQYGKDFPHYTIENIINNKNGMIKNINVKEIKDSVLPEVASEMVEYLKSQYDNLDIFDAIALVGGTSNALKPNLTPLLAELGFTDDRVRMVTPLLREEKVPVEYAVAVGAYKILGE